MRPKRRLRRAEAVVYLLENHGIRRTVGTLAKLAVVGGGPRFRVAGRTPLYEPDDLDAWVESILSPPVGSTSELREYRAERHARGSWSRHEPGDSSMKSSAEPDVSAIKRRRQ